MTAIPTPLLHPPAQPLEQRRVRRRSGSAVERFTRGVRVTPCGHLSPDRQGSRRARDGSGMISDLPPPRPPGISLLSGTTKQWFFQRGEGRGATVWLKWLSEPPLSFSQTWGFGLEPEVLCPHVANSFRPAALLPVFSPGIAQLITP